MRGSSFPGAARPDPQHVARLKAALERDLERLLEWRGPVAEVRRLVAELDRLDAQCRRAELAHADDMVPRIEYENSHAR